MFPHQQMAATMMPQPAIYCFTTCDFSCGYSCHICSRTCWDASWGGGGGCGGITATVTQVVEAADPASALEALRKNLEMTLAGVQAQERLLNERKAAGEKK
jgi:hypothetical protein